MKTEVAQFAEWLDFVKPSLRDLIKAFNLLSIETKSVVREALCLRYGISRIRRPYFTDKPFMVSLMVIAARLHEERVSVGSM